MADTPGVTKAESKWAEGPSMPAAREACDALLAACADAESDSTFLFLVGGAGNGKSFLAKRVAQYAGTFPQADTPYANRTYDVDVVEGRTLRIVNDATIPPAGEWESGGDALRNDIDAAVRANGHLLCCVNRGVLIRETMNSAPGQTIGTALLHWLASNRSDQIVGLPEGWESSVASAVPGRDHYVFARIDGPAASFNVHVVFMDNASLLEPEPDGSISNHAPPAVPTQSRRVLSVWKPKGDESRMFVPALVQTAASYLDDLQDEDAATAADPVYANARVLSRNGNAQRWASLARGAEVISGTHFTYRDLWGLVSLSLTGVLQGPTMESHAEWVARRLREVDTGNLQKRLDAMLQLATLRTHQAVFSSRLSELTCPGNQLDQSYPTAQALRSMIMADPVRCLDRDVRKIVAEKLFLLEEDAKPGHRLAASDPGFESCWTDFDELLEDSVVEWLHREDPDPSSASSRKQVSRRRAVVAWYGEYLARLLSFSRGLCAFPELVHRWQVTWQAASTGPAVSLDDDELESGLLNLAFPARGGKAALPIFDEHIVPPGEGGGGARILVQVKQKDYKIRATTRGDKVILSLQHDIHGGENELLLDFALARETLVRHEGRGFTDAMFDIEPRVERLRAGGMMLAIGGTAEQVSGKVLFERGDQVVSSSAI